MGRHSTSRTRAPRAPRVYTIHRTTVRVASFCIFEVVRTTSSARGRTCFCSRTSLYTTAACSTARTPRRPAGNSAIDSWTTSSSTSPKPRVWSRKNNHNRNERQQPRSTMYHGWSMSKIVWLPGYVNWPYKIKQHLFLMFDNRTSNWGLLSFNIQPHSNLANVIVLKS